MARGKKILIVVAIIFFAAILLISYDISRRTTFPGSKPQLQERIKKEYLQDTLTNSADTIG